MTLAIFYHHGLHPEHAENRILSREQANEMTEYVDLPVVVPVIGDLFKSRFEGRVVQRRVNIKEMRLEIWVNPVDQYWTK